MNSIEQEKARKTSEKVISAFVSLALLWIGTFITGLAVIVLVRLFIWFWHLTEFQV